MNTTWEIVKLERFFVVKKGQSITKKDSNSGIYPVILGGREPAYYIDKYNHTGKAIVVSRSGASAGYVSFWNEPIFVTDGFLIEPKDDVNYEFVYYLLKLKQSQLLGSQRGAAIPHVTPNLLYNVQAFFPPLAIQKRIASILSAYDNLIENNNKRIKILEQMAENLYKEWFVRFRFPGHETTPFENGIPKGWKIERLGNAANISTGKSNRQDADEDGIYPFFDRSQEIKRSNIWLKDCEAIIVPGEGTTFYPRYYQGKFDLHQRCYCVEPKVKEIGKFLFYVLNMNRYYFLSVATGATVPSLRQNNFLSMKYLMPSIDLCKKFNQIVSKLFDQKDHLKEENQNLIKQRDLLLPRLMSGKLAV